MTETVKSQEPTAQAIADANCTRKEFVTEQVVGRVMDLVCQGVERPVTGKVYTRDLFRRD